MSRNIERRLVLDSQRPSDSQSSERRVRSLKNRWLAHIRHLEPESQRLLRLALTEAEALASQTVFPELFFPALALEKTEKTVAWILRQNEIRDINETVLTE